MCGYPDDGGAHIPRSTRQPRAPTLVFIARVAVVFAGALVLAVAVEAATVPPVRGTVGPEFTISLKKHGKRVTALKRGRYSFVIADRSTVHNFRLEGPGVARDLTGVARVGTTRTTLRLRPGRYTFFCVPHPLDMRGTFRVA
jgi:hypothetical protein